MMMTDRDVPSYQASLFNVAVSCARLQKDKKIQRKYPCKFVCEECYECNYYVGNYADVSPSDMKLLMLQAKDRVYEDRQNMQAAASIGRFAFAGLIVAFLLAAWGFHKMGLDTINFEPEQGSGYLNNTQIWDVLTMVGHGIDKKIDVNGDGESNCIDAAVMFYSYYPNSKTHVKMISNTGPGMSHLFIALRVAPNGAWQYIEPSAEHSLWWYGDNDPRTTFLMSRVWAGTAYDPKYNRDRTDYYKRYAW